MSGLPNKDGVTKLREFAAKFHASQRDINIAQNDLERSQRRLEIATAASEEAHAGIIAMLDSMDCAANGNTGWKHRIAWMLAEMEAQGHEQGKSDAARRIE